MESNTSKLLWDAEIIAVHKNPQGKVLKYKVHYKEWGSRFDNWVDAKRVVEPSNNNITVQVSLAYFYLHLSISTKMRSSF